MILENIKQVNFEIVKEIYLAKHGLKRDGWELRNLKRANQKFGSWISTDIPISEIGNIVMPHHNHGGITVIPKKGALLSEAYKLITQERKRIEQGNSQFYKRIKAQKKNILANGSGTIFLSEEPLLIGTTYAGLTQFKGQITHLDGLHRLIALMDLDIKQEFVPSYIAIYPNSKLMQPLTQQAPPKPL